MKIKGDYMTVKVFISSNQNEFFEERKLIKKELESDSMFKNYVDVFVFEENEARSLSPQENFIEGLYNSDVYIGLIGLSYGDIKDNGLSSTEYEYEIFSRLKNKQNIYFFIKDSNERDDRALDFIERIKSDTSFKIFHNTVELIEEIKRSLKAHINQSLSNQEFDFQLLAESSCDDVSKEALDLLFDSIDYQPILDLLGNRDMESILEILSLGKKDLSGTFRLNNAGALFLAENIEKFNIEHEVKMVRFKGNTKLEMIDKCYTTSPFFILLKEFEHFYWKNIKVGSVINGLRRVNIPEYPFNAIREAMINALAHRDYSFKGSFIQFYIYDDRIEIISPGNLLYPLKVSNLKNIEVPVHRNKNICNLFSKTIFMEHVGSGIQRMCDEMRKSGLREPEFINGEGFFKVIFWGPNGALIYPEEAMDNNVLDLTKVGLNDRQIRALSRIVNEKVKYSYERYSNEFDVSKSTSKRDLNDLAKKGLVIENKSNRRNYYFVE